VGAKRSASCIGVAAGIVAGLAMRAAAQCALCGQGTAYAAPNPTRAFATFTGATLVLLLPTLVILTLLGRFLWKHRDA
jgi:hypothetical protein